MAAALVQFGDEGLRHQLSDLDLGKQRFHWRHEPADRKFAACEILARAEALHLVVVGMPMDKHRQQRARNTCPRALDHCRSRSLVGGGMRIEFGSPEREVLIVAADIAAGAVGEHIEGRPEFFAVFQRRAEIHEVVIT